MIDQNPQNKFLHKSIEPLWCTSQPILHMQLDIYLLADLDRLRGTDRTHPHWINSRYKLSRLPKMKIVVVVRYERHTTHEHIDKTQCDTRIGSVCWVLLLF